MRLVAETEVDELAHVLDGVALVGTDVAIVRVRPEGPHGTCPDWTSFLFSGKMAVWLA
jgi:hypothetical protein